MPGSFVAALVFTVLLLVTTGYFLMGSIPLLLLKHDEPMDARFVRAFFRVYFVLAVGCATATALFYALAGRLALAAGAAVLAGVTLILKRLLLARMDALQVQIGLAGDPAIRAFRRTHMAAILANLVQIVVIVGGLAMAL